MTEATKVKIKVQTQSGDKHEIETPLDIRASDFIDELVDALKLPKVDAEGRPINWRMDNKDTGKTLDHDRTLEENGVEQDHQLSLMRQVVAGSASTREGEAR